MKKYFIAMVLGLMIGSYANASEGRIVVSCEKTYFSDLTKIEIQETDLAGQYQIIETLFDSSSKKETSKYSPVFSMKDIETSNFPELTSWAGYSRLLTRSGINDYMIELHDECNGSFTNIICKEMF